MRVKVISLSGQIAWAEDEAAAEVTAEVAELVELQRKRITCPVAWCEGRALDHGADGAGPDVWLHEGTDEPLHDVFTATRVREGSGPDRFSLSVDLPDSRDYDAAGLRDLADRLRAAADEVDERASRLEATR